MDAPVLSEFVDYRKYLAAFLHHQRDLTSDRLRPYSYSDFSAAADIKSPNYLKLIIDGKRNLSRDMCHKFSKALRHSRREAKEFELLVTYCQEKDPMQRNRALKELSDFRSDQLIANGAIDEKVWDQMGDWLVWVLYAMIDQEGTVFKPASLVRHLGGQANEAQVERALQRLIAAGDIEIDPLTGFAKRLGSSTGPQEIPAELVRKIQSELIYLGLESLHRDAPHEREIGGFTMAMTEKEFEWVRFELRKLRKNLQKELAIKRQSEPGERVYQVNIQLFPLSEKGAQEASSEIEAKKNPLRP